MWFVAGSPSESIVLRTSVRDLAGSPYGRFGRALDTGDATIALAAAAELDEHGRWKVHKKRSTAAYMDAASVTAEGYCLQVAPARVRGGREVHADSD
jgi:hypothetical protein